MFKFQSTGDCQQRLASTVICVNGRPFYVQESLGADVVKGYDTRARDKTDTVTLSANCISTPQVGYINKDERAVYLTRKPVRRIRQGLCKENLTADRGVINTELLSGIAFAKMVLNEYPSFEEAYKLTVERRKVYSSAFSRNFAITHESLLLYSGEIVGTVNADLTVTLKDKFSCLKELYEHESKRPS